MAKFYKLSEKRINTELDYEYRKPRSYKFEENSVMESHEFVGFSQDEIYDKVKTFLEGLTRAVKINIRLGFKLIDRTNGLERDYYPSTNTEIWPSTAVAINSKADVERKVMSYMKASDFTERINYPSSAYQLKEINSVVIVIYKRDHILGDSEIKIPERFSKSHHIINFPKTNNKCVFFCIAYHLIEGEKPRRVVSYAKQRVKQFCAYENIPYSPKVYKDFKPVDIMQFDKLEDCFKVGINVWQMDDESQEILKIRAPGKEYDNKMNILDYNGHAMYITELDHVLSKYPCNSCDGIFDSAEKLRDHKKTKCQLDVLESFAKKPTLYRPSENRVKSLLSKYKVYDVDHYMDHFIVYDFEAILEDKNRQSGRNTKYTKYHHAISVSVCDSLTQEVKCFVAGTVR